MIDLSELFVEPFQHSFMRRALTVSVLVGVMCPVIGAYVVARGRAFMGDALAHSVLPGMGVGLLATGSALIAAVPAGVAIALLMGFISRRTGSSEDTSIGIVFAGMFALGLVMLSSPLYIDAFIQIRGRQAPNIEDLLIGEILGVNTGEVYLSLGLAALVIAGLYVFHRPLVYTTFDPVGAEVVGIRARLMEYVLLALLALVIVISIQAAGIVLVMAMLITPAATGFPCRAAVRGSHGHRRADRRNVGGGRHVPLLPRQHAHGPGDGLGRDRGIRRGSGIQEE